MNINQRVVAGTKGLVVAIIKASSIQCLDEKHVYWRCSAETTEYDSAKIRFDRGEDEENTMKS